MDTTAKLNETTSLFGQCKWTWMNSFLTCFLSLIFIINVVACVVIWRVPITTSRRTTNPVYLCIRLLNSVDILQVFLFTFSPLFSDSDCRWAGGDSSCKGFGFFALLFVMVSPLITIVMAVDRLVAIYFPIKYRNNLGMTVLKFFLPFVLAISLLLTIPPMFGIGEYHVVRGRRLCLLDTITDDPIDQAFILILHGLFLLFLLLMLICTMAFRVKVTSILLSKKKTPASKRNANSATRTTMAVCVIFVVCYSPFVLRVLYEASTRKKSPPVLTWTTFSLVFLQPLLNPVVCLWTNTRYRTEFQILFKQIKRADVRMTSDSATNTVRDNTSGNRHWIFCKGGIRRRVFSNDTSGRDIPLSAGSKVNEEIVISFSDVNQLDSDFEKVQKFSKICVNKDRVDAKVKSFTFFRNSYANIGKKFPTNNLSRELRTCVGGAPSFHASDEEIFKNKATKVDELTGDTTSEIRDKMASEHDNLQENKTIYKKVGVCFHGSTEGIQH